MRKEDNSGNENNRSSRNFWGMILLISISMAVGFKMLLSVDAVRSAIEGPSKFVFVPILLFLGYLGTKIRH
ncbi:hypothetical protein Tlie_1155 [Thermovirga lienii DSM 17291]|uniref:Uncharacterized protein n=1 Tax=Thermovirga lienii (strain ATCC BAA-1197 / DSM 17291 / Cas60314) TaxID=580340 RepID=G7V5A4_THELD|nr:hypothetical protein [Thermovirga lienii]MDN5318094.1 hypothetical protein [Thermovirga sp.]AER66887.1 hypothetical protein Tlie_1155 [Thermovirga lienii DSM 17291]KUK43002.1 MAG: Uncharacterized protein XD70_0182 [Thermovirga lienii]MDN5367305.1 hypothetical protein [Thermovirga sp.]HCD71960.1 hypothetical protein [Thermovirga lienii]